MWTTCGGERQEIDVLGKDHTTLDAREIEVLFVARTEHCGFWYREDIHAALPQTCDDSSGNVLI